MVAFKALGLSMWSLATPAVVLGIAATLMSAQTSFYLGPWGNRQFELLMNELGRQKVAATLKEGVFSEGFFDMVIYANEVDSNSNQLKDVFIYDEHDPKAPVTIIAREGQVIHQSTLLGHSALLRLTDGNVHRTLHNNYTKVDFKSYDINLFDPFDTSEKKKSPPSMTIDEVAHQLRTAKLEDRQRRKLEIEYQRRWSLSAASLIFALLGVGLGTVTNRRSSKGGGFVVCLVLLVAYWILYLSAEGIARNGWVSAGVSLWSVNALFLLAAIRTLRKTWAY
jgi:lipopolysaccharide export system permease protein